MIILFQSKIHLESFDKYRYILISVVVVGVFHCVIITALLSDIICSVDFIDINFGWAPVASRLLNLIQPQTSRTNSAVRTTPEIDKHQFVLCL